MFATIRHAAVIVAAATATLATVGFAAAPASAAPLDETRSVQVRHADLDLASARGVATLRHRVRTAVTSVCGSGDTRDLAVRQQIIACRTGATASARPAMELAIANAGADTKLARNDAGPSIRIAAH